MEAEEGDLLLWRLGLEWLLKRIHISFLAGGLQIPIMSSAKIIKGNTYNKP